MDYAVRRGWDHLVLLLIDAKADIHYTTGSLQVGRHAHRPEPQWQLIDRFPLVPGLLKGSMHFRLSW